MMFAVEGPLWWALALYAGIGAVALPFAVMKPLRRPSPFALGVVAAGVLFGIALWSIAGQLDGDGLFHLARIRKLEAFDNLGLESVNEFVDGGLHPGYAFPLWHVLMGLVAWLAGVDAGAALLHEPSVLVPVAFVVAYEAGVAILRTAWAGIAALLAAVALTGLAPGRGGAYAALSLPATSSRHLLAPATGGRVLRLRQEAGMGGGAHRGSRLPRARARPPDVRDLRRRAPGAATSLARLVLARGELARGAAGLAFVLVPAAGVAAWLAPIVQDTASHSPSAAERARGLAHYPGQVDVFSADSFRLAPEMLGRAGAVAIAALVAVPLAAFASRRRWSAYVLGGAVALLAILLHPAALHAVLGCRVAFAGAARGRLRAARGGIRRGSGRARAARVLVGDPGRAGSRESRSSSRTRESSRIAWTRAARRSRRGSRSPAARSRSIVAAVLGKRGTRDDRGPLSAAVAGAFVLPVAIFGFGHWETAHVRALPADPRARRAARSAPGRRRRPLGRLDGVLGGLGRARVHRRGPAWPRGRYRGEPAVRAPRRREPLREDGRPRHRQALPRRLRARPAGPLAPRSISLSRLSTATAATFSTACEAAHRLAVLPARGRRRRPAAAEVRHPSTRAGHRDARAGAGRPEVGAPRRRAQAADAGVDPPGALRRPRGSPPGRGAARHDAASTASAFRQASSGAACSSPTRTSAGR